MQNRGYAKAQSAREGGAFWKRSGSFCFFWLLLLAGERILAQPAAATPPSSPPKFYFYYATNLSPKTVNLIGVSTTWYVSKYKYGEIDVTTGNLGAKQGGGSTTTKWDDVEWELATQRPGSGDNIIILPGDIAHIESDLTVRRIYVGFGPIPTLNATRQIIITMDPSVTIEVDVLQIGNKTSYPKGSAPRWEMGPKTRIEAKTISGAGVLSMGTLGMSGSSKSRLIKVDQLDDVTIEGNGENAVIEVYGNSFKPASINTPQIEMRIVCLPGSTVEIGQTKVMPDPPYHIGILSCQRAAGVSGGGSSTVVVYRNLKTARHVNVEKHVDLQLSAKLQNQGNLEGEGKVVVRKNHILEVGNDVNIDTIESQGDSTIQTEGQFAPKTYIPDKGTLIVTGGATPSRIGENVLSLNNLTLEKEVISEGKGTMTLEGSLLAPSTKLTANDLTSMVVKGDLTLKEWDVAPRFTTLTVGGDLRAPDLANIDLIMNNDNQSVFHLHEDLEVKSFEVQEDRVTLKHSSKGGTGKLDVKGALKGNGSLISQVAAVVDGSVENIDLTWESPTLEVRGDFLPQEYDPGKSTLTLSKTSSSPSPRKVGLVTVVGGAPPTIDGSKVMKFYNLILQDDLKMRNSWRVQTITGSGSLTTGAYNLHVKGTMDIQALTVGENRTKVGGHCRIVRFQAGSNSTLIMAGTALNKGLSLGGVPPSIVPNLELQEASMSVLLESPLHVVNLYGQGKLLTEDHPLTIKENGKVIGITLQGGTIQVEKNANFSPAFYKPGTGKLTLASTANLSPGIQDFYDLHLETGSRIMDSAWNVKHDLTGDTLTTADHELTVEGTIKLKALTVGNNTTTVKGDFFVDTFTHNNQGRLLVTGGATPSRIGENVLSLNNLTLEKEVISEGKGTMTLEGSLLAPSTKLTANDLTSMVVKGDLTLKEWDVAPRFTTLTVGGDLLRAPDLANIDLIMNNNNQSVFHLHEDLEVKSFEVQEDKVTLKHSSKGGTGKLDVKGALKGNGSLISQVEAVVDGSVENIDLTWESPTLEVRGNFLPQEYDPGKSTLTLSKTSSSPSPKKVGLVTVVGGAPPTIDESKVMKFHNLILLDDVTMASPWDAEWIMGSGSLTTRDYDLHVKASMEIEALTVGENRTAVGGDFRIARFQAGSNSTLVMIGTARNKKLSLGGVPPSIVPNLELQEASMSVILESPLHVVNLYGQGKLLTEDHPLTIKENGKVIGITLHGGTIQVEKNANFSPAFYKPGTGKLTLASTANLSPGIQDFYDLHLETGSRIMDSAWNVKHDLTGDTLTTADHELTVEGTIKLKALTVGNNTTTVKGDFFVDTFTHNNQGRLLVTGGATPSRIGENVLSLNNLTLEKEVISEGKGTMTLEGSLLAPSTKLTANDLTSMVVKGDLTLKEWDVAPRFTTLTVGGDLLRAPDLANIDLIMNNNNQSVFHLHEDLEVKSFEVQEDKVTLKHSSKGGTGKLDVKGALKGNGSLISQVEAVVDGSVENIDLTWGSPTLEVRGNFLPQEYDPGKSTLTLSKTSSSPSPKKVGLVTVVGGAPPTIDESKVMKFYNLILLDDVTMASPWNAEWIMGSGSLTTGDHDLDVAASMVIEALTVGENRTKVGGHCRIVRFQAGSNSTLIMAGTALNKGLFLGGVPPSIVPNLELQEASMSVLLESPLHVVNLYGQGKLLTEDHPLTIKENGKVTGITLQGGTIQVEKNANFSPAFYKPGTGKLTLASTANLSPGIQDFYDLHLETGSRIMDSAWNVKHDLTGDTLTTADHDLTVEGTIKLKALTVGNNTTTVKGDFFVDTFTHNNQGRLLVTGGATPSRIGENVLSLNNLTLEKEVISEGKGTMTLEGSLLAPSTKLTANDLTSMVVKGDLTLKEWDVAPRFTTLTVGGDLLRAPDLANIDLIMNNDNQSVFHLHEDLEVKSFEVQEDRVTLKHSSKGGTGKLDVKGALKGNGSLISQVEAVVDGSVENIDLTWESPTLEVRGDFLPQEYDPGKSTLTLSKTSSSPSPRKVGLVTVVGGAPPTIDESKVMKFHNLILLDDVTMASPWDAEWIIGSGSLTTADHDLTVEGTIKLKALTVGNNTTTVKGDFFVDTFTHNNQGRLLVTGGATPSRIGENVLSLNNLTLEKEVISEGKGTMTLEGSLLAPSTKLTANDLTSMVVKGDLTLKEWDVAPRFTTLTVGGDLLRAPDLANIDLIMNNNNQSAFHLHEDLEVKSFEVQEDRVTLKHSSKGGTGKLDVKGALKGNGSLISQVEAVVDGSVENIDLTWESPTLEVRGNFLPQEYDPGKSTLTLSKTSSSPSPKKVGLVTVVGGAPPTIDGSREIKFDHLILQDDLKMRSPWQVERSLTIGDNGSLDADRHILTLGGNLTVVKDRIDGTGKKTSRFTYDKSVGSQHQLILKGSGTGKGGVFKKTGGEELDLGRVTLESGIFSVASKVALRHLRVQNGEITFQEDAHVGGDVIHEGGKIASEGRGKLFLVGDWQGGAVSANTPLAVKVHFITGKKGPTGVSPPAKPESQLKASYALEEVSVGKGKTLRLMSPLTVRGNLLIEETGVLNPESPTQKITVGGWNNQGTFQEKETEVTLASSAAGDSEVKGQAIFHAFRKKNAQEGILATDLVIKKEMFIEEGTFRVTDNHTITHQGDMWEILSGGTFDPGEGRVLIEGKKVALLGDFDFYNFVYIVRSGTLEFGKGNTICVKKGGRFIVGEAGWTRPPSNVIDPALLTYPPKGQWDFIVLKRWREPTVSADTILVPERPGNSENPHPEQWIMKFERGSKGVLNSLVVGESYGMPHVNPSRDSLILLNVDYWGGEINVVASWTEDTDKNGRIDRIRVQFPPQVHLGHIEQARIEVDGYTIDTYVPSTAPGREFEFFIKLEENDNQFDTGEILTWRFPNSENNVGGLVSEYGWGLVNENDGEVKIHTTSDAASPTIGYTLGIAGRKQIFLRFTEPVLVGDLGEVTKDDFAFGGESPVSLTRLTTEGKGLIEGVLTLHDPLTRRDILVSERVLSLVVAMRDKSDKPKDLLPVLIEKYLASQKSKGPNLSQKSKGPNLSQKIAKWTKLLSFDISSLSAGKKHRASDLALHSDFSPIAKPLHLWTREPEVHSLIDNKVGWVDGEVVLKEGKIAILAGMNSQVRQILAKNLTMDLIYGVGVGDEYTMGKGGIWTSKQMNLPAIVPRVFPRAVYVPANSSPEFSYDLDLGQQEVDHQTVDFFFVLRGAKDAEKNLREIYVARVHDPDDPQWYRAITLWSFSTETPPISKGGVFVANNILNPRKGGTAILNYSLSGGESVVVKVFDLSGELVRVLYKGTQGAGRYRLGWNGRNESGKEVARGIYFIRIVTDTLDETRKVLVVR